MKVFILCKDDYCGCEKGVVIKKVILDKEELKKELEKLSKLETYIIIQTWENGVKIEEKFIKFKDFI